MKICGIIAEFNPLHNGHAYLMSEAKARLNADFCVVVMSGAFTQRGTPACLYKYSRVKQALSSGADLVLELPVSYATATAEVFAHGGISILNSLGCIDSYAFGSECGDVDLLAAAAGSLISQTPEKKELISAYLKEGLSFPAARMKAYPEFESCLKDPNNILGIEYIKSALRLGSSMTPFTITRKGDGYHEHSKGEYPSAEGIREVLKAHEGNPGVSSSLLNDLSSSVPEAALAILADSLDKYGYISEDSLSQIADYAILTQTPDRMAGWQDMNTDIARRFKKSYGSCETVSELLMSMKTKELTYTRLSRCLLHLILTMPDLTRDGEGRLLPCPYTRILGFRKDASELMHLIASSSEIPLVNKAADAESLLSPEALAVYEQNALADRLFDILIKDKNGTRPADGYRISPVIM